MVVQENKQATGDDGSGGCCELADLLSPRFFRALCDSNRVRMVERLARCAEACTVSQVAEWCEVDLSVVSRHLSILREAGVVEATRQGREVRYRVRVERVVRLLRNLADALEACCPTVGCQPGCEAESKSETETEARDG